MLDRDHISVSEAVCLGWLVTTHTNNLPLALACITGTFIGSQLPDIDTTSSKIGHYTKPLSSIIAHFGHRGITHSLIGLLLCFCVVHLVLLTHLCMRMYILFGHNWYWLLNWVLLGYGLHLIEDWFSWPGLIWLFPLGHYRTWRPVPRWIKHRLQNRKYKHYTRKEKRIIAKEPPIYVETKITKWFRYHSTDRGKKGRYERNIRRLSYLAITIEIIMILLKA